MSKNADEAFDRLTRAVNRGRSYSYCLSLWSEFVRTRDGHRCVLCHSKRRLVAHHIARKCFLPSAKFATGNGITLCRKCHAEPHAVFNGKPDMKEPMDVQGCENIDLMVSLYRALAEDARSRNQCRDNYYFLNDQILTTFKRFQDLPLSATISGTPVEQAYWIWRQTRAPLLALLEANGVTLPCDFIQLRGITIFE
jgi:hypothetical protein